MPRSLHINTDGKEHLTVPEDAPIRPGWSRLAVGIPEARAALEAVIVESGGIRHTRLDVAGPEGVVIL